MDRQNDILARGDAVEAQEGWSGIEFTSDTLMRPALEFLRAKLAINDTGLSPSPRRLLIRSPWREGGTLRATFPTETSFRKEF